MKKIKDILTSNNEEVELILRLSDVQIKKTSTNEDYASMLGFDGEEKIEAKIWNFTDDMKKALVNGEVYKVVARTKQYQNRTQLNVLSIERIPNDGSVDLTSYYEKAKIGSNELASKINDYFKKIDNAILQNIVSILLKRHFDDFFNYPAAVTMHHNYYSGLAYHTYSMLKLSDAYLAQYPFINSDLVYSGIILHDIGKLYELSGPKGTEYTKMGKLIGHISLGANEIYSVAKELNVEDSEEVLNLLHIILSHHGQLEYGSPKEPMTPEATLIHFLDYCDSKLAALEPEVEKTKKGEFTAPISSFDRKNFYIPNLK
ncbi:MAG: HD domain-containing protein [Bacilli bacterium]|mgnify:CR=1 FL=1|nr:HD domain-containing protein [Acholeplasmataceae bacterium]MDY2901951.1 HD domain-containing protein [Bacilli bacterium]